MGPHKSAADETAATIATLTRRAEEAETRAAELANTLADAERVLDEARWYAADDSIDRHDRRCAVWRAARGRVAVCSCGLKELRAAVAALRKTRR